MSDASRPKDQALRESEARLRAVVNTAVTPIITIDHVGIVESFNPAAERLFGYIANEVIGENVSMLMPAPYKDEHDKYIQRYLKTGVRKIIGIGRQVLGRRKDGSVFPMDLAVSEIRIDDRRIFTGIIRDLSDHKRLEKEVLEISANERQWIGRDLHDGLGQELTGIALLTGALQKKLAEAESAAADDAAEIVGLVNQAIDHTRALVKGLCPVLQEDDGLTTSMQELARTVQNVYGLPCDFDCPETISVPDHMLATHLHYIANEAVNNALKHAEPTRLAIGLHHEPDGVRLSVEDDGVGIHPDRMKSPGRGLHIMRFRAQMVGGTLQIEEGPLGGTLVSCQVGEPYFRQKPEVES